MFKLGSFNAFKFYQFHEVFVYIYAETLEMFGLESGRLRPAEVQFVKDDLTTEQIMGYGSQKYFYTGGFKYCKKFILKPDI